MNDLELLPDSELVPPADLDAEAAVISAAIIDVAATDACREILSPRDFYSQANRWVWKAILGVSDSDQPLDAVAVRAWLEAEDKLEQIGGSTYLAQLMDATPSVANVENHARIVADLGAARRMIASMQRLAAEGYEPGTKHDVADYLQRCEGAVFSAAQLESATETASSMKELMVQELGEPSDVVGMSTGLASIDGLTGGLCDGEDWVIAGRPGMGKSALALQLAIHVASCNEPVAFFSLEMRRRELRGRAIAVETGIGATKIRKKKLSSAEWSAVTAAIEKLGHLPLIIDEAEELTPARLKSRCRRHAATFRRPLRLIVVDYLQLLEADPKKRSSSRQEELEYISRALKRLARYFGCCLLSCAQLNRAAAERKDKRPGLSDLRGSGAIEQDADTILFVHREDGYRTNRGDHDGVAEFILAKGRACGTGQRFVKFEDFCTRFIDDGDQDELDFEERYP